MIFQPGANNVTMMRAVNADQYAGALVSWREDGDILAPTGHTWDKTLSGRLSFTVDVAADTYDLFALLDTGGRECWLWVEVDRQRRLVGPKSFGRTLHQSNGFAWSDGGGESQFTLSAGRHVIDIYSLTAGLELDAMVLQPSTGSTISNGDGSNVYPAENIDPQITREDANQQNYADWLRDESRDAHRVVLVEIDHAEGTLRLATLPYISDDHHVYDDWLIGEPYLEYGLTEALDLGDLEFTYPDLDVDLLSNNWRGYQCRMLNGDLSWRSSDFRLVASATVEAFETIEDRTYRVDLVSDSQKYRRTFHTGDAIVQSHTVENAIEWILAQYEGSGSFQYINVDPSELDKQLSFDVTESTTMEELINTVARSINAETRITQAGFLEIITPDVTNPAPVTLNDDNVVDRLRMIDTIYPVSRVIVTYNRGEDRVTVDTSAQTGILDEEVIIESFLTSATDAEVLGGIEAERYSNVRNVWELNVVRSTEVMQVGDRVSIDHPELVDIGVLSQVRRTPLSYIGRVEVTI